MRTFTFVVVTALAAIVAASAFAAGNTPSGSVYHPKASQVQGVLGEGHRTAPMTSTTAGKAGTGATLPFTGFDIALLIGAGAVLTAAGCSLRRVTRKPPLS